MKEISSKIVGLRVASNEARKEIFPSMVPDHDPLTSRIDRRPDGALEAVAEKIDYHTQEGRKRVYLVVSFMPVEGWLDGAPVSLERPVEFFVPGGLSSEHQWVTATMRSLSLAARAGFVAKALQDLRKVVWDKGPVRLGVNAHGKPLYHNSEVAAIAWSLQQILIRRGFLSEDGSPRQAREIIFSALYPEQGTVEGATPTPPPVAAGSVVETCPECRGDMVLMDGCATCIDCGHSKCG